MHRRHPLAALAVCPTLALATLLHAGVTRAAAPTPPVDETSRTREAVLAVDDHWGRAEVSGDERYLQELLLPAYRTVNPDGVVHTKADLIAHAVKNRGNAKALQELADDEKAHPLGSSVVLDGDLAIVTFYVPSLGPQKGITSSDVFVYRGGHWRAAYSQHSNAARR